MLADVCLQGSAGTLIALSRRMYKTKVAPGQSVHSHVDALCDCFRQMELRGKKTLNRIFLLLSSLLPQYKPVITSIESESVADLEWAAVVGRLLDFDARMTSHGALSASRRVAKPSEAWRVASSLLPDIQKLLL